MSYRVGIDIGGTFTDFTVIGDDGQVLLWKEHSDPDDPATPVRSGLAAIAEQLEVSAADFLGEVSLLVHGTTIATNTLIQRNGPRIGLLCTTGLRDVLYFRNAFKPERFNIHLGHPGELVPRYLRLPVDERIGPDGNIIGALDEEQVRHAAATLRDQEVKAVAVAFMWSVVNPAHERRAAEILREELQGVPVLVSSDVLPEMREWHRASATALSAYVLPRIGGYLDELREELASTGLRTPLLIMQSNGGCATVDEVVQRPVNVVASGPAAAPAAARYHSRNLETADVITVDMGGTSFDVCLVRDGRPTMSRDIQVESQPIGVQAVEVHSIGAGGGSVAWIDSGGALRVGPRSAGARPGPACYGNGGEEPTVTDANVVLGYLDPQAFLGGRSRLRRDLAEAAIDQRIAKPLGLGTLEAAEGIQRIVNANMVSAIRAVSVERGIDPRNFTIVAGGGAGSLHAAALARELGIGRVAIPRQAGTFCSFGMTVTDVTHDYARAHHELSDSLDADAIAAIFVELEERAAGELTRSGFTEGQIAFERKVDARYPGQVHELTIDVPSRNLDDKGRRRLVDAFHRDHERMFTWSRPELAVEFLHWRVSATGHLPSGTQERNDDPGTATAPSGATGRAYFRGYGELPTRFFDASALAPGATVEGPAVVSSATTTVLVNPDDTLSVQADRSYVIDIDLEGARS
jgi:N-methylhydantoinase A